MRLTYARMAPDDGNGGGAGGEQQQQQQGEGQQAQTPPNPVETKLDALLKRMEQQDQMIAQMAQGSQQRQTQQREEEPQQEEGYVDPEVKAARLEAKQARMQSSRVADMMDQQQFIQEVTTKGVAKEDAQYGLEIYNHWVRSGMTFGGQPPSRVDALRYGLGAKYGTQQRTEQNNQQVQEQQRQQQNQQAFTERGGGGNSNQYRVDVPQDFEKKPLPEQSKVIGQNLDKAFPDGW